MIAVRAGAEAPALRASTLDARRLDPPRESAPNPALHIPTCVTNTLHTCIIANPNARGGKEQIAALEEALAQWPESRLFLTSDTGHAESLARRAAEDGFEQVVAAGGDGTIHEVLNGLADHFGRVRLGILPLGTGNDLARTLGLADLELAAAVEVLRNGHGHPSDVVRVRDDAKGLRRYFVNVSGAGFSGELDQTLTAEMKRAWGPLAYLRAAIESLGDLTRYQIEMLIDDEERLVTDGLNLVVANGRFVAAGIEIAPRAEIDSGFAELLVLRPETLPELAGLARRVLAGGQHLDDPDDERVIYRRIRTLEVTSDPPMPLNADGELIGHLPCRFEVVPAALEIALPLASQEPRPSALVAHSA